MPRTTGLALIYSSEEASTIEPGFIVKRHKRVRGDDSDDAEGGDE
jgi:ribosomal protein S24E